MINSKFVDELKAVKVKDTDFGMISVYDLIMKRYEQMKKSAAHFEPFTGPIKDNTGKVQIKTGAKATKGELLSIMYYVDNVVGSIPK